MTMQSTAIPSADMTSSSTHEVAGFLIECNDGEKVKVSARWAKQLEQATPYFQSMFAHGTVESTTRNIVKASWTTTMAQDLIKLLLQHQVGICNVERTIDLAFVADEVMVECVLLHPFDSSKTLSKGRTRDLIGALDSNCHVFDLQYSHLNIGRWELSLDHGLLLTVDWDVLTVVTMPASGNPPVLTGSYYSHSISNKSYPVHSAKDPISALMALPMILGSESVKASSSLTGKNKLRDVRDPFVLNLGKMNPEFSTTGQRQVAKEAEGCILTLGSAYGDWWTMKGSGSMLLRAFTKARCYMIHNRAELVLPFENLSHDTLEQLVKACFHCEDHPGTLGFSADSSSFFVVKTIPDMSTLLKSLAASDELPVEGGTSTLKPFTVTVLQEDVLDRSDVYVF